MRKTFLVLAWLLLAMATTAHATEYKIATSRVMLEGLNLGHAREMSIESAERQLDGFAHDGWRVAAVSATPEGSGYYLLTFVLERGASSVAATVAAPQPTSMPNMAAGIPTSTPPVAGSATPAPPLVPMTGFCTVHGFKGDFTLAFGRPTEITLASGLVLDGTLLRYEQGVLVLETPSGISQFKETQIKDATQAP